MPDISTRVNAIITYLFLGPIILLARKGTPLSEIFVREHAKRATFIMSIGLIAFIFYHLLRGYLSVSIFGISLGGVILTTIVSITLLVLTRGAYQAYHGVNASEISWELSIPANTTSESLYSEDDKIRIIASFIPFIGIIVASRYPRQETFIGRKIGNLLTLIILTSIVFFSGTTSTLTLIITIIYIGLIISTLVQLFGFSRFLSFSFYTKIPTYHEFDAHIKSFLISTYEFFGIALGKTKTRSYGSLYEEILHHNTNIKPPSVPYFTKPWIIAIPGVNLISLPSLWQSQYREYFPLILQGVSITLFAGMIIWFYGIGSKMGLYLIFPILVLIAELSQNLNTRAPITSIIVDIYELFTRGKTKIDQIKENGEKKVGFTYEVK